MSEDLAVLIKQYALDLRRNASGGDDYPFDFAKGVSEYLGELIKRAKGNCTCAQAGFPDSCDNCDGIARLRAKIEAAHKALERCVEVIEWSLISDGHSIEATPTSVLGAARAVLTPSPDGPTK